MYEIAVASDNRTIREGGGIRPYTYALILKYDARENDPGSTFWFRRDVDRQDFAATWRKLGGFTVEIVS